MKLKSLLQLVKQLKQPSSVLAVYDLALLIPSLPEKFTTCREPDVSDYIVKEHVFRP